MRRSFKPIVTALVLAGLLAVTAFSAVETFRNRPGVRSQREREQLVAWLLSPQAAGDSLGAKRQMARRAAAAFRLGYDWKSVMAGLSQPEQKLLLQNFSDLTAVWLAGRADDWLRRPRKRRGETLDREVQALLDWKLPATAPEAAATDESDAARLDRLRALAQTCFQHELIDERKQAFELLDAARGHVLARGWMRWLPGGDDAGQK